MDTCGRCAVCFGNPCHILTTEYLTVHPRCDFGSDRITTRYHFHSDRWPRQLRLDEPTWDLHTSRSIHHAHVLTSPSAGQTKNCPQLLWRRINWMLRENDARDPSLSGAQSDGKASDCDLISANSASSKQVAEESFWTEEGWGDNRLKKKMHNEELHKYSSNNNSVAWVRELTIPTERPPLVGEVSVNFCRYRVLRVQHNGSLRP
jgi:hypothetical protein